MNSKITYHQQVTYCGNRAAANVAMVSGTVLTGMRTALLMGERHEHISVKNYLPIRTYQLYL